MYRLALVLLPVGLLVGGYSYLKREAAPTILFWVIYTVGLFQWIVRVENNYPLRLIYPFLASFFPASAFTAVWVINFFFWWIGSLFFYYFLRSVVVNTGHYRGYGGIGEIMNVGRISRPEALLGTLIPLLNYSTIVHGFFHVDGLNWIIVVGCFYSVYKYLNNKKYQYIKIGTNRYLLLLAGFIILGLLNDYPMPSTRTILPFYDGVFALATIAIQLPFILRGVEKPRPWFLKQSLWFIPIYIVIACFTTDWCRWVVFAAPITIPLMIRGMREYG